MEKSEWIQGEIYVTTHRIIYWDNQKGFEIPLQVLDEKVDTEKFYQKGHWVWVSTYSLNSCDWFYELMNLNYSKFYDKQGL